MKEYDNIEDYEDEVYIHCSRCKEETYHKVSGFLFSNRRYICNVCNHVIWDENNE